MKYRKEFFDLQFLFARRVAEISGIPLGRAVFDYTNIYVRLAIGRGFDAAHPVWLDYVDGLNRAPDAGEWTHRFYLTRPESGPPNVAATFGCFSYSHDAPDCVRLHFENREKELVSPLSAERANARKEELRLLVGHVRETRPDVRRVSGVSWLYNLPAYRRLFPAAYLASATVTGDRFRNMPLWGQFLDREGRVKPSAAAVFAERLAGQVTLDSLADCFPLQPLAVEAPLSEFCRQLEPG